MDVSNLKDLILLLRSDSYAVFILGVIVVVLFIFYDVRENKQLTKVSGTGLGVASVIVGILLAINWFNAILSTVANTPPVVPKADKQPGTTIVQTTKSSQLPPKIIPTAPIEKVAIIPKAIPVPPAKIQPVPEPPLTSKNGIIVLKNPGFDEYYENNGAWTAEWPKKGNKKASIKQGKSYVCLKHAGSGIDGPELVLSQRVSLTSLNDLVFSAGIWIESYQSDFDRLGYPAIDLIFEDAEKKQVFGITLTPDKFHQSSARASKVLYRKLAETVAAQDLWNGEISANLSTILRQSTSAKVAESIRTMNIQIVLDIPKGEHCRKCGMGLNWVKLEQKQNRGNEDVSINTVRNISGVSCFNRS